MAKTTQRPNNFLFLLILTIVIGGSGYILGKSSIHREMKNDSENVLLQKPQQKSTQFLIKTTGNMTEYHNSDYGFTFTYPSKFQFSTEESWPKAVVLLRKPNSQAYDLSVEVATSQDELNSLVVKQREIRLGWGVVKQQGNIYVVLGNSGKDPEIDKIIDSFRFTK